MVIIGTEASSRVRVCVYASACAKLLVLAGGFRQLTNMDPRQTGGMSGRQTAHSDAGMDRSDPGFAPGSPESGPEASFSKNPGMPPMVGGVGIVLSNLGHFPALFRALSIRQGIGAACRTGRPYAQARAALKMASDSGITGIPPESPIFEESGHDPYSWWGPHPFLRQRRFWSRFRGSGPRTVIQIPYPAVACRPAGFSCGHLRVLLPD